MLVLWNIWPIRHDTKHRVAPFKASSIIFKTLDYLQNISRSKLWRLEHLKGDLIATNFLQLPLLQNLKNKKSAFVHLSKPGPGWYKLNNDGASKSNPGPLGAGGLLRDHKSQVLFAFLEPLEISTNTSADLQALYSGLQICLEKGFHKILIEVDALHIIQLISKPISPRNLVSPNTSLQIRLCLAQLEIKLSHIYRGQPSSRLAC
ncbi:hypothetical protein Sango_1584000 [Sesamum angolense]|uniref:RNase H type-1 domain-containing protein n=1 Tax=Sesamum angolense TaxID=2727404 RepID=A0AAE2BTR9_9LAMI|nr:hypothetical protein Sango_1584000 [Sesamum angolense]